DVFAWFQHDFVLTASQQVVKLAVGLNNAQAALHFSGWVLLAGLRVVLDHDTSLDRLPLANVGGKSNLLDGDFLLRGELDRHYVDANPRFGHRAGNRPGIAEV